MKFYNITPSSKLEPMQGLGSVFILYGSGSSILGWIPIRIQSGSTVFMGHFCPSGSGPLTWLNPDLIRIRIRTLNLCHLFMGIRFTDKINFRLGSADISIHCMLTSISLWLMVVLSLVTSWARSDLCLTSSSSLSSARFFSPENIYHA